MVAVDCTIDDLVNKMNEWIPLWCGDVATQLGDNVAIPVEYKQLYALTRYRSDGRFYANGPVQIGDTDINLMEQELQYVNTIHGCRIFRLNGVYSYTDSFLMLFGKLTPPQLISRAVSIIITYFENMGVIIYG